MEQNNKEAIELRKEAKYYESRSLLEIANQQSLCGEKLHLQIKCGHMTNEGKSLKPSIITLIFVWRVVSDRTLRCFICLASTYRSLGQYLEALSYFEQTLSEYPDSIEVQPFLCNVFVQCRAS